jgi:murein L,D-transpeptidase YcbB/YkuD
VPLILSFTVPPSIGRSFIKSLKLEGSFGAAGRLGASCLPPRKRTTRGISLPSILFSAALALESLAALGVLGNAAVSAPHHRAPRPEVELMATNSAMSTRAALRARFHPGTASTPKTALAIFYAQRNFDPVWSGNEQAASRAASVRSALEGADRQGLRSRDYTSALSSWDKSPPKPGRDAAAYDATLTAALLHYASDLRTGRVKPRDVYRDVNLPPPDFDPTAALSVALKQDSLASFLTDLAPVHPGYSYLVQALAHYRAIVAKGGWPVVPGSKGFALDGSDKRLAILASRLAFEDPVLAADPAPSADAIHDALLRFERRNGLPQDDNVGPDVLKVLNVPATYRVQQIIANMERWRWMPRFLESRYVEVDVPDQSVSYIDSGSALLYSRVVIGKPSTPTPILRTTVEAVIANPFWRIPDDIAARKLLPKLRDKPDYLRTRNMVLAGGPANDPHGTKINWRHVRVTNLRYQIEQSPGPDNALGTILFEMPNDFDVYLHDTPEKNLLSLDMREKSNGCVRVEKIAGLASLVLSGGKDDADSDLADAVASGKTQRIPLENTLAVYMLYWTVIAESDGTVHFRPDRYDRDRRLIAKLQGARSAGA